MGLLISKRKLFRLSFGLIFAMGVIAVYMIYRDVFYTQPGEFGVHGSYGGTVDYQLYGPKFREKEMRNKPPLQTTRELMPDDSRNRDTDKRNDEFDERRDRDRYEEAFVTSQPLVESTYAAEVYRDDEMFENMKDIHNMDGLKESQFLPNFGNNVVDLGGRGQYEEEFQYPEVGYRYQNALHVPQSIMHPKQTVSTGTVHHGYIIPALKNNALATKVKDSLKTKVKKKVMKSNSHSKWKAKSPKKRPMTVPAFPPPPDSMPIKSPEETKYLVYLCDTSNLCGGWGDRQRGMLATYFLSRVVGRQMKIIMNTPCNLTLFYVPHKVQWLPNSSELRTTSNITINSLADSSFKLSLMTNDFNAMHPQKVVYLKTNQDYYVRLQKNPHYSQILSQWSALASKEARFRWAWNDLFQPSEMLLTHVEQIVGSGLLMRKGLLPTNIGIAHPYKSDSIYNVGNSTLICAHARVGKNPTIPMDNDFNSFVISDVPVLHNFMLSRDVHRDALFFVASDSDQIRLLSHKFFGDRFINYGGKILHIDRQRTEQNACVGFEAALMDQLILSLCDFLVVSRSGFSIHASYMGNVTQPVYIMEDRKLGELHI